MKRILSVFLVVAMLLSFADEAVLAATKKDVNVLFFQTFDDVTTHTVPSVGSYSSQDTYVADTGKGNKFLIMRSNTDGFIKAEYTGLKLPAVFGFTIELALPAGKVNGDLTLVGSGSKQIKLLNFTEKEGIKNVAGYKIGGLKKTKQRFTFIYNSNKSTYSIYIDDKCVNHNYYLESSQLVKDITTLKISLYPEGNSNVELQMDNLYFYEGDDFLKAKHLPKSVFNTNSIKYESAELVSKESVYFIRDWEEPAKMPFHEMTKRIQSGSSAIMDVVESDDGNHYLKWIDDKKGNRLDAGLIYSSEYTGDAHADKRFIIVQMNMSGEDIASSKTSVTIEDEGRFHTLNLWTTNGNNIVAGGKTVGTLSKDKWTNIAACFDVATKTTDIFVNYKEVASDIKFNVSEFGYANMICINNSGGIIHLDNIACYSGRSPRPMSYNSFETISMIRADRADMSVMKTIEVLNTNSGRLFKEGKLICDDTDLYILNNEKPYINAKTICDMYETAFASNNKGILVNGVQISDIISKGDNIYAPYDRVFDAHGKKTYYDTRGMIVAYTGELNTSGYGKFRDYGLWDIFDYTNYDRPSPEEIEAIFNEKSAGVHPRLLYSKELIEQTRERIEKYDDVRILYERKYNAAVNNLNSPPIAPQLNFEKNNGTSRSFYSRIREFGEVYLVSGEKRFADKMWSDLEYVFANWDDWFPFETLGYAATMSAVACVYDWCYNDFTPEQRKTIEEKLYFECLELGFQIHNGLADIHAREHLNAVNNRNAVISGSYIVACSALMDVYPKEASSLIHQMLKQLEMFGRSFFPGGTYEEGYTYWTYGMQYFNRAVSTLDNTFGQDFGLYSAPDIDEAPYWIVHGSSLNEPNNYGDSSSGSPMECMGDFGYIAKKIGDPAIEQLKRVYLKKFNMVNDDLWYSVPESADSLTEIQMEKDSYFKTLEQINFRSEWGTDQATFLSAHGGYALPSHGHLDTGAFVFEMLGERWAVELPMEDYNYQYEVAATATDDMKKYSRGNHAEPLCYLLRPEGHNTIVINPGPESGHNMDAFSPITEFVSKQKGVYAVMDMTNCYKDYAKSAQRGYMLGDDRRSVIIRDEVTAIKPNSEMYWFMYTKSDVEIIDDKTAILTQKGKQIKMQIVSSDENAKIETGPAKPLETSVKYQKKSSDGYNKVFVKLSLPQSGYIHTRFIPVTDPKVNAPIDDIAIKDWSIADGEIVPLPALDMLYKNGEALEAFSNDAYSYNLKLVEGEALPAITVLAKDIYDYEITNAQTVNDITNIKIWLKSDPSFYAEYSISYEVIPKLSDYMGYRRLDIFDISSNNIPQTENGPYNLIDDDITTRHAMNSMGNTWTRFDLGSKTEIDAFAMAVFEGASRLNSFTIEVSDDGANWTEIYSGTNSGTTDQLEIYTFPSVYARYIRINPKSCSVSSTWYSTTEFYPMKKR